MDICYYCLARVLLFFFWEGDLVMIFFKETQFFDELMRLCQLRLPLALSRAKVQSLTQAQSRFFFPGHLNLGGVLCIQRSSGCPGCPLFPVDERRQDLSWFLPWKPGCCFFSRFCEKRNGLPRKSSS